MLASHIPAEELKPCRSISGKAETKRKYNHTVAPLAIAQRDGTTILTARLTGNFPGSPVTLQFCFVLEDGKIASLEIRP